MPRRGPIDRVSKDGGNWVWDGELWAPHEGPDAGKTSKPYWAVRVIGQGTATLPPTASWGNPNSAAMASTDARAVTSARAAVKSAVRSARGHFGARGQAVRTNEWRQHRNGSTKAKRTVLMRFPVKNIGVLGTLRAARTGSRARR